MTPGPWNRSCSITTVKKAEYGIYNLNSTDITFSEISEQWLYSVRQGVKESTFAHYQHTLRHYLQPVFGDFKVSALSEKILEQGLLAVITPTNGKQKPLGATMAREFLSMLRRICKYTPNSGTAKNKKAVELGVKRITEDELNEMIGRRVE